LSENISVKLSFNDTNDFHMNCVVFKNLWIIQVYIVHLIIQF
jgi:hypothetical protein